MLNDHEPHIGKNVIETLTLSMYDDAYFIFREYIQNSADQIDIAVEQNLLKTRADGKIILTIDQHQKLICIEDNATGIRSNHLLRFLGDVANSEKEPNNRKGFRGIGRLGGLAYCEKLVFETSFKGESIKSIMTLDALLLRKIIEDRSDKSNAARVISIITTIEHENELSKNHYFKVKMVNVTNDAVLDAVKVEQYLSMVAPLPFSSQFSFSTQITNHFKINNFSVDEYNIFTGTKQLFKAYKNVVVDGTEITNIIGVDFFTIEDNLGKLLAIGWYGIRDYVNEALTNHSIERGIRLRKSNIQIGKDDTLNRFFAAERTNFRFVGELHAISPSLVPNARRDYFSDNKTAQLFGKELEKIFKTNNWENTLAQNASKMHNRLKDIEEYKSLLNKLDEQSKKIDSVEREQQFKEKIISAKDKAVKASKEIEKVQQKAKNNKNIQKLYDHIIGESDLSFDSNIEDRLKPKIYDPPVFNKLSASEGQVALEIINLIYETNLSLDEKDMLKKLIIKKFN